MLRFESGAAHFFSKAGRKNGPLRRKIVNLYNVLSPA
jgi:hypothetical protein